MITLNELVNQTMSGKQFMKATELVYMLTELICTDHQHLKTINGKDIDVVAHLERMCERKELDKVEYILADSDYKIRTLYFEKGTMLYL